MTTNLFVLSTYINKQLRASSNKPQWAATNKQKRAIRYAEAYSKNAELIASLNGLKLTHAKAGI